MFVTKKEFEKFSNKAIRMLATMQIDLAKSSCSENACKCCQHGTVVALPDGTAKTVCGKQLKQQCPDFTPRDFGEFASI